MTTADAVPAAPSKNTKSLKLKLLGVVIAAATRGG